MPQQSDLVHLVEVHLAILELLSDRPEEEAIELLLEEARNVVGASFVRHMAREWKVLEIHDMRIIE